MDGAPSIINEKVLQRLPNVFLNLGKCTDFPWKVFLRVSFGSAPRAVFTHAVAIIASPRRALKSRCFKNLLQALYIDIYAIFCHMTLRSTGSNIFVESCVWFILLQIIGYFVFCRLMKICWRNITLTSARNHSSHLWSSMSNLDLLLLWWVNSLCIYIYSRTRIKEPTL